MGKTASVGTALLASMRGLRQEMRDMRTELRDEIRAVDHSVHADQSLLEEMKASDAAIKEEMTAGFKELSARMVDIGDRLSRIEGIIEGMFWGSRNQPPDKPREGVA